MPGFFERMQKQRMRAELPNNSKDSGYKRKSFSFDTLPSVVELKRTEVAMDQRMDKKMELVVEDQKLLNQALKELNMYQIKNEDLEGKIFKHLVPKNSVSRTMKSAGIDRLKELYEMFDQNESGDIDAEELQVGLSKLGHDYSYEVIEKLMAEGDVNSTGTLDYGEFIVLILAILNGDTKYNAD